MPNIESIDCKGIRFGSSFDDDVHQTSTSFAFNLTCPKRLKFFYINIEVVASWVKNKSEAFDYLLFHFSYQDVHEAFYSICGGENNGPGDSNQMTATTRQFFMEFSQGETALN